MVQATVPPSLIAERRRLGLDKKDEMWEGVLHMNDPGSVEHQRMEARMLVTFSPVADRLGLMVLPEVGIFDPEVADNKNFRTPDLLVARPGTWSERGIEGRAALAIEIRSPGDESLQKIDFYGRVGVEELLVIDRDTKAVRRWIYSGTQLDEVSSDADGWHQLTALPAAMTAIDAKLQIVVDNHTEEI